MNNKINTARYITINVLVLLVTLLFFVTNFLKYLPSLVSLNWGAVAIILVSVLLVHFIKAIRLFFILYETNINPVAYIKTYCKATPVSMIIPFKIGEFFRIYCYSNLLSNFIQGLAVILLDRFMDTAAMVTIIIAVGLFYGINFNTFIVFLFIFILIVMLIYSSFPGLYTFFNKRLIKSLPSESNISKLKLLKSINSFYKETMNIAKTRGLLLFSVSLGAWLIEIGSVALLCRLLKLTEIDEIDAYLMSPMRSAPSTLFTGFVLVSVIVLLIVYVLLKAIEKLRRK